MPTIKSPGRGSPHVSNAVLYFGLGFLTACLVALVLLGAVWRRVVRLVARKPEKLP